MSARIGAVNGHISRRLLSLLFVSLLAAAALMATGCGSKRDDAGTPAAAEHHAAKYACPMDPEITSDKPDQRCPKCGMLLVPVKSTPETNAAAPAKDPGKQQFICPMHPTYVSDRPGDCPICGMRLVPAEQVNAGEEGTGAPGLAAIRLTGEGIRLAGVQTVAAHGGSVARTIRTVGTVVADDARVRRVQVKSEGYVERLFVNTPGQQVRRGDPLLSIYSPDLLAGQEEYLRALEARKNLAGDSDPATNGSAAADRLRDAELLVRAARERLQLLDVPDGVLAELEKTGRASRTVTLRAPVSGAVTERAAYEGMKVMPGMELFTITDLSQVWIEGSFYESEAPFVAVGGEAELSLAYDPSVRLHGTVQFVYPYLDPESRTLRARFSFPSEGGLLKPGMYANVTLQAEDAQGVIVPDNAVMDTGERKIVFVSKGGGRFEPREVETGLHGDGTVQILSGVMEGEELVVRANFLLDSESRIRSALSGSSGEPAAAASSGHQHGGD